VTSFKVGDWIINTELQIIKQYTERDLAYDNMSSLKRATNGWKLYKPYPREWYWFWNLPKFLPMFKQKV